MMGHRITGTPFISSAGTVARVALGHLAFALLFLLAYAFNLELFLIINLGGGPIFDSTMDFLTQLGDGYFAFFVFALLLFSSVDNGLRGLSTLVVLLVSIWFLKELFDLQRPAAVLEDVRIMGQVFRHGGFPSGHTATVFAFAVLCRHWWGWKGVPFLGIAVLSGFSRVYVGAHFPVDVVAGAYVGSMAAWSVLHLPALPIRVQTGTSRRPLAHTLALAIALIGLALFMQHTHEPAATSPMFYTLLFWVVVLVSAGHACRALLSVFGKPLPYTPSHGIGPMAIRASGRKRLAEVILPDAFLR